MNDEFVKVVEEPIRLVWGQIGSGVYPSTNNDAVELCIEASLLSTYGGENGDPALLRIRSWVAEHGYAAVINFLASRVRLI